MCIGGLALAALHQRGSVPLPGQCAALSRAGGARRLTVGHGGFARGGRAGGEIKRAFCRRGRYYMITNILWDRTMRYSREHKLETHARIVRKASVRLREKGAHGIGVADLMKEAGLTHGGFYAHFDSREALVIEAFADAMDRSTERWRKLGEATTPDRRFATIVDSYLTALHRDNPGHGCAIPTLGAEIARESPRTRKAFAAKLEQMIEVLAAQLPDVPRKAARKQATAAIATMMGTMVMARVAGNGDFSEEILQAGRDAVLGSGRSSSPPAKKSPGRSTAPRKAAAPVRP